MFLWVVSQRIATASKCCQVQGSLSWCINSFGSNYEFILLKPLIDKGIIMQIFSYFFFDTNTLYSVNSELFIYGVGRTRFFSGLPLISYDSLVRLLSSLSLSFLIWNVRYFMRWFLRSFLSPKLSLFVKFLIEHILSAFLWPHNQ